MLAVFFASAALVRVRGELAPEVIVLLLALMVVVVGRLTNVVGGVLAAVVAATSFNFFFTQPYLSLRIHAWRDVGITVALLAVGLVAGPVSARTRRERRMATSHDMDVDAIRRVLDVAGERSIEDVELAVRAELLKLLDLAECSFTTARVTVPELGATGGLPRLPLVHHKDGFQLPQNGFAIPAIAAGERVGALVCVPVPGVGVDAARRRTAVALAHILALAIVAGAGSNRKAING